MRYPIPFYCTLVFFATFSALGSDTLDYTNFFHADKDSEGAYTLLPSAACRVMNSKTGMLSTKKLREVRFVKIGSLRMIYATLTHGLSSTHAGIVSVNNDIEQAIKLSTKPDDFGEMSTNTDRYAVELAKHLKDIPGVDPTELVRGEIHCHPSDSTQYYRISKSKAVLELNASTAGGHTPARKVGSCGGGKKACKVRYIIPAKDTPYTVRITGDRRWDLSGRIRIQR